MNGVVIREDELLSRHTAWRTGGPCGAYVLVHRRDALETTLAMCREKYGAITVLGAGTRSIVRDAGLAGAVVRLGSDFADIVRTGATWNVGGATPVPVLISDAQLAGMAGAEALVGVPGSVGASVLLDEGWDALVGSVRVIARGKERDISLAEARAMRSTVVLSVRLLFVPETAAKVATSTAKARRTTRTLASSWYERPKRGPLREVLDRASLGGVRLRAAAIPAMAPELLTNLGGASARDLWLLHHSAMERVIRETGVELVPRVSFLGRA